MQRTNYDINDNSGLLNYMCGNNLKHELNDEEQRHAWYINIRTYVQLSSFALLHSFNSMETKQYIFHLYLKQ